MVKIIVIFTIVFVYYCEINAEIHLQNKETATADFQQNSLETEEDQADIKPLERRARKETQTKRHTTVSREDSSGLSEFVQSDNEAHINMFFKPGVVISRRFNKSGVVNSRRFNIIYKVEENTETNGLDSESMKPKSSKKHHHHARKKIGENKKHDSAHNEGKEIHEKDEKYMEGNDSSSGSSTEKLHTQKYQSNIKDRDGKKKSKHPKDTSMSHEIEKDKKKQVKEKSKDKKRKKRMDKAKTGIHRLSTDTYSSENDKTNEKKQLKEKTRKNNETSEKNKVEVLIAAEFKTTVKVTKPPQRNILEKKPTTTKSTKPKPTHQMPKVQKNPPRQSPLRAHSDHKRPDKKLRHQDVMDNNDAVPTKLSPYAIMTQMKLLMKEFPEANVTVTKSAHTVEYNDIVLVTIREGLSDNATTYFRARESKYIDDDPEKKIIFIVHGLTTMGLKHMTSLIDITEFKLLMSYYLKHLDKFDFMVMPLANPDGYSASLASDGTIWNKNMSPQDVCSGVFLDRNFDVSWSNSRDISSCSQLYPGPTAFSEEESKAVRDVLHHYSHKILAYIHVHAGTFDANVFKGEAVLYPKGYTFTQSDDDKYIDMKGEIDEAMKNASFRVMTVTVDTLANWYGIVRGTSVDYAATVYGIPYALEFVMQIYDTEDATNGALTQIWSRVIDATFNNIWKSLQRGVDARRKPIFD